MGIPGRFHQHFDNLRRPRVRQKNTMHSGSEYLLDHPVVGPHHGLVDSAKGQHGNHCGSPMPTLRRSAIDQPLHKGS